MRCEPSTTSDASSEQIQHPPDLAPDIQPDLVPDITPEPVPDILDASDELTGEEPHSPDLDNPDFIISQCLPFEMGDTLTVEDRPLEVRGVAYSLDGKHYAAITQQGEVRVWEQATHLLLHEFKVQSTGEMLSVAFTRDGKHLATWGEDGALRLWQGNREVRSLLAPGVGLKGTAFAKSNMQDNQGKDLDVFVVGYDATSGKGLIAWHIIGETENITRHKETPSPVRSITLTSDAKYTIIGLDNGDLQVWLSNEAKLEFSYTKASPSSIRSLAMHKENKYMAAHSGADIQIWLINPADEQNPLQIAQVLQGHRYPVIALAFDAEGKWLVSLSADNTNPLIGELKLWDTSSLKGDNPQIAEILSPSLRTDLGYKSLAWHPIEKNHRLLFGSAMGRVVTWLIDGEMVVFFAPPPSDELFHSLSYSPDDKMFAAGTNTGFLHIKDLSSNGPTYRKNVGSPVLQVLWEPESSMVIGRLADGSIKFWDQFLDENKSSLKTYIRENGQRKALSMAIRQDRKGITVGYDDGSVIFLDPKDPQKALMSWSKLHDDGILSMHWSRDGHSLATADKNSVRVWQFPSFIEQPKMLTEWIIPAANSPPTRVQFHALDHLLAVGLSGGKFAVWIANTPQWKSYSSPTGAEILIWNPDNDLLYTASNKAASDAKMDGSVQIWDATNPQDLRHLYTFSGNPPQKHTKPLTDVTFNTNGHLMITSGQDQTYRTWRVRRGRIVGANTFAALPISLAVRPDGRQLAIGTLNGQIQIWDITSSGNTRRHTINEPHRQGVSVAITRRGDRMITYSNDQTVMLWDLLAQTPSIKTRFPAEGSSFKFLETISGIHLNPSETHLVISSLQHTQASKPGMGQVSIWNLQNANAPEFVTSELPMLFSVAWHPTRDIVLAGHMAYTDQSNKNIPAGAIAWHKDGSQWTELRRYENLHVSNTMILVFEPNAGEIVASTDLYGDIKIWRLDDGKVLHQLNTGGPRVLRLLFHPSGNFIAAALNNGKIMIWDVKNGKLSRFLINPDLKKAGFTTLAHRDPVASMAWSINGNVLYTGGGFEVIRWLCTN
jgi:WD40 repeat protein